MSEKQRIIEYEAEVVEEPVTNRFTCPACGCETRMWDYPSSSMRSNYIDTNILPNGLVTCYRCKALLKIKPKKGEKK